MKEETHLDRARRREQAERSGANGSHREPRPPEPWEAPLAFDESPTPEFPLGTLPEWLREFVEQTAEETQTPPDLGAMLALATAGAGLARKFRVCARPGWTQPLNLYVAAVLLSGERKSAVFDRIMAPVAEFEKKTQDQAAPRLAEEASRRRQLEMRLRTAETHAARAEGDDRRVAEQQAAAQARELAATPENVPPVIVADDITPESLGQVLSQQGGRLLVASDEGAPFENALGRYSDKPGSKFENYLKAYDGGTIRVNRIGRTPDLVRQPALSMAMAIQPVVLASLAEEKRSKEQGFLARFMFGVPRSRVGFRRIAPPPADGGVVDLYRRLMLQLWELPGAVDEHGVERAHLLELSPPAELALRRFEELLEPRLKRDEGDLAHMAEWAAKMAGAGLRLAGILHMLAETEDGDHWRRMVPAEPLRAALTIAESYLLPHAQQAFGLMGRDPELEAAKKVLQWLSDHGSKRFTKRELFRSLQHVFKRVESLDPILSLLAKHGYLREAVEEGPRTPGRPSQAFDVNPMWEPAPRGDALP